MDRTMFIPLIRNVQEKMVSVSVVKEDRIICISQDMFKLYEMALSEFDGIEIRSSFIDFSSLFVYRKKLTFKQINGLHKNI